jgi:hypothetical protein
MGNGPYILNIDSNVSGTPQVAALGTETEKLDARTKLLNNALYGAGVASEKMTISMARLAIEETKLEALREKHRMSTEGLTAASVKATAAQEAATAAALKGAAANDALAVGTTRVVGSTMAASTALRVMEGSMPLRSAAAFLGTIQGFGPAMQLAFPVFGAIALFGIVEKIGHSLGDHLFSWKEIANAEKTATDQLNKYGDSARQTLLAIKGLQQDVFTTQYGPVAGAQREVQSAGVDLNQAQTKQRDLQEQRAALEKYIGQAKTGVGNPNLSDRETMAFQKAIGGVKGTTDRAPEVVLQFAQSALRDVGGALGNADADIQKARTLLIQAQQKAAAALDEEAKARQDVARELAAEAAAIREQSARTAIQMRKAEQGPTAALLEKYAGLLPADRAGMADFMRGALPRTADKQFMTFVEKQLRGGIGTGYEDAFSPDGKTPHKLTLTDFDDSAAAEAQYKNQKEAVSVYNTAELGRVNTQVGTIRDTANRQGRLLAAGASPSDELSTLRQQIQLRKDAASQEFALKATHSDILDIDKARLEYVKEIGDADLDYQTKILSLKKQQKEETVSMAVGLIMAAQHGGAVGYLKSQAEGLEGKILTNLGRAAIDSPTGTAITNRLHAGAGTFLGTALQGTPFGPDPMKSAGVSLNTAGTNLNTAATGLISAARELAMSRSGGGGSASGIFSGMPGTLAAGSGGGDTAYNPADMASAGYGTPEFDASGNAVTVDRAAGPGGVSNLGRNIGIAGAAAAGAYGIYSGVREGGARGALSASASVIGSGTAILTAVLPKLMATAGPIGMAAGMVLGMIPMLMGDPVAQKRQQIADTLQHNQFMAPVSVNASMSTAGGYSDMDRFGNVRDSTFSPFPNVSQGFFDYRNGVTVPGRTNSQFGGQNPGPQVVMNIQNMDAKNFIDHSQNIADAVNHALQTGRAAPLAETLSSRGA